MFNQRTFVVILAIAAVLFACFWYYTDRKYSDERTYTAPAFDDNSTPRSLAKKDTFYDGDSIYVLTTTLDSAYSMDEMQNAK